MHFNPSESQTISTNGTTRKVVIWFIGMIIAATSVSAHAKELDMLHWLQGRWLEQRGEDEQIEVQWNPVIGDAMTGTWSRTKDGSLAQYEILTMRKIGDEIYYRFDLYKKNEAGLFEKSSELRLRLIDTTENLARFHIVDEENWILTMDASGGILRGWMVDKNAPPPESPRYNYFARKVE